MAGIGRRTLAAWVLTGGLAAGAVAQSSGQTDILKQAELKRQTAEAVATADVTDAITKAQSLARSAPEKAVQNLKGTLGTVNTFAGISEAKRNALSGQVEAAISGIQRGDKPATPTAIDPKVLARIEQSRKVVDAAAAEAKDVQAAIAEISKDFEARRDREAKLKIAAIAARYPNNGAVITLQTQQGTADSILAAKDISRRSAEAFIASLNSVQAAAIPIKGDVEFPRDWKAKMELREKLNAPQLTAEEEKLVRSLETVVQKGVKDAPFEEAIQMLSTTIDQKLYLDKRSLEDLGVDLRKPVEVPGGVSARTALRVMLQQVQLTFVIRDNIIQVVGLERAKELMVTRAYDVRDIVSGGGLFNNPLVWGPYLDAQQTEANGRMIVEAIQKSIDPKVWRDTAGGPATVLFHYGSMSIIVRAPSDVHADLHKKLYGRKK